MRIDAINADFGKVYQDEISVSDGIGVNRAAMMGICQGFDYSREDSEDIVQDVSLELVVTVNAKAAPESLSVRAFLLYRTRKRCLDRLIKSKREAEVLADIDPELFPSATDPDLSLPAIVEDAFNTLSPKQRECAELFLQGYEPSKIAAMRGVSCAAVTKMGHRVESNLRKYAKI